MITDKITVTITTPSDRETEITREFDAPVALVFDAVTKADLIKRWYGPPGTLEVCESDFRVGGVWRFSMNVGGNRMTKHGVYTEIDAPRRFVRTEYYEGWDIGEIVMSVDFVERGGKTMMTQRFKFPTQDVRDQIMKMGATPQGMSAFYARLDELLGSIA